MSYPEKGTVLILYINIIENILLNLFKTAKLSESVINQKVTRFI